MSCVLCACDCKVACVFAGCTAMSICKFYSTMTCLECPVPAIARWSVSLLGAQPCQFVSSTQSRHDLSALCLRMQGGLCFCLVHSHVNCKFYSIMTCPECPQPATARGVCLCLVHSHVNLQVLLNHDVWVPCACNCKVVCVFAGSTVLSICKFYSIMTCLSVLCLQLPRWSVSLLGAQSCQFLSFTQSWHIWVYCACDCKVICIFAGSTVMSICKFYSIMTCLSVLCLRLQGGLCLW